MLDRLQVPNDLDSAIEQIQLAEKALAAQQLSKIAEQLAELAKSAHTLVGPIEPSILINTGEMPTS